MKQPKPAKKTAAKKTVARKTVAKKTAARKKPARTRPADRERALALAERLQQAIPEPQCELDFRTPWQLLVATILSAQSTDRMVNKVTPVLFQRYPTSAALAAASQEDVEALVKQTGFFRNKAKAIREASRLVEENFAGEVPRTLEELVTLPGVARKTANVVLGNAYGLASGIAIDTHAGRVSRRLALTAEEDPVKVEKVLCDLFPREDWVNIGHRFVLHGRYICLARTPKCGACPLNELCPSANAPPEGHVDARAAAEWRIVSTRGEG